MICTCHIYYSGDQIKKHEMGGARRTYGEKIGAYRVLVGKPEGKRPLGKPNNRWEDNIKVDLQDMGLVSRAGLM